MVGTKAVGDVNAIPAFLHTDQCCKRSQSSVQCLVVEGSYLALRPEDQSQVEWTVGNRCGTTTTLRVAFDGRRHPSLVEARAAALG